MTPSDRVSRFVESAGQEYTAPAITFSDPQPIVVAGGRFAVLSRDGGLDLNSIHTLGAHHWHQLFAGVQRSVVHPATGMAPLVAGNSGKDAYFHMLLETMGAVLAYRALGHGDAPVIVPPLDAEWRRDLAAFLAPDTTWIEVPGDALASFDRAVLTNMTGRSSGFAPHPHVLALFAQAAAPLPRSGRGRRLYISRRDAPDRRPMRNEAELIALLQARGFYVLTPGGLSPAEQAATFRDAAVIVGPHGAGLANLLYCRNGSQGPKMLELLSEGYPGRCYVKLAQAKGLAYAALINSEVETADHFHRSAWECDLDMVRAILPHLDA
ncbi:glycosyltransferase 61 family protein [uncultured Sphingomonas sp.]|uniref:glycosyltransferase family 61 protein n=1 Tax=uncultured Sphingomonas sp. TaxID=158754 RepID=UPI0025D5567D|nr:glycosyltransferase 61 family protein [uncultured Sphingomonas sp.]